MVGLRTDRLAALPATFTTGQAELVGLWRRDLYLLRDDGVVSEISREVYRKSEAPETAHLDFLVVAHRAPLAVVCLISALMSHELTDEVPAVVQIAVPRGTHRPRIAYPPTEVSEFDPRTSTSVSRSVKSHRGVSVDLRAGSLGRGRDETAAPGGGSGGAAALAERPDTDLAELLDYARALDVEGPVRQAVAVLS
jgi:predicted transcriptional regulator of viral defense system